MKVLLSIICVLFVNTVIAQSPNKWAYQDQYNMENKSSQTEAINQRNTGRVLTFVGIAALAIDGAVALSTLGQTTTTTCNPCTIPTTDSQDQIENIVFLVAATTTTVGIILWTKGSRRMKAPNLSFNWKGRGGVLRYKF